MQSHSMRKCWETKRKSHFRQKFIFSLTNKSNFYFYIFPTFIMPSSILSFSFTTTHSRSTGASGVNWNCANYEFWMRKLSRIKIHLFSSHFPFPKANISVRAHVSFHCVAKAKSQRATRSWTDIADIRLITTAGRTSGVGFIFNYGLLKQKYFWWCFNVGCVKRRLPNWIFLRSFNLCFLRCLIILTFWSPASSYSLESKFYSWKERNAFGGEESPIRLARSGIQDNTQREEKGK